MNNPKREMLDRSWLVLVLVVGLVVGAVLLWRSGREPPSSSLAELRRRAIPGEGTATAYGIPLSLVNAQRFADWYYEFRLAPAEEAILVRALGSVPTPCCDDTRLVRCCCEEGGLICNLVRSARGLAAWLIREKRWDAAAVRSAVEEWLRFAHPDYYLARELEALGQDPEAYGLSRRGACYRGWCEATLSRGGCGGMGPQVRI